MTSHGKGLVVCRTRDTEQRGTKVPENLPHVGGQLSHAQSIASFPGPAQLSVACSTEKRERGPGIFSHVSDVRIERMVERV